MRRVLIVSTTYVEPTHRGKLVALAARGLEVTAAVPHRWPEPVLGRLRPTAWEREKGVEIFPLPVTGTTLAAARFGARELRALIRDKRPDVLQLEHPLGTPLATQVAAAARKAGAPLVVCTTENDRRGSFFARRRRRRVLATARGALAGGAAAAEVLRGARPDCPVTTLPQLGVVVPPEPLHEPHDGLAIGVVGRLEPRRGLDTLLQALATLRGAEWMLTVVGDGPDRERLEALASARRLAARIRWTGTLPPDHLARLWSTLDVLVSATRLLPDWQEPAAGAVAEAMAHEVAVVGTAAGVAPELIGDAGLIVPPDDPDAMAAALMQLASPVARRTLAQAARARAIQCWSDEAIAERTLEFWRGILGT